MERSLVAPLELHHTVTVCQARAAGMIADVVYLESYTGLAQTSTSEESNGSNILQRSVDVRLYQKYI